MASNGGSESKASFVFTSCSYTVETTLSGKPKTVPCGKSATKPLLRGVSADVEAGHVLAILGPSGAGKTTLLNMLTLEKKAGGWPTGLLTLNGHPFTLELYKRNCAYVQQADSLWACLTARDHLEYAYALYQPGLTASERTAAVDDVVKTLGLAEVQHTRAGNQFTRGLSGGLKRRLSIGLALAKRPLAVFLDEPTTGVDSASAAMMMTFLKTIAAQKTIAILCTIHQPPASVFAGFDNALVLASGRVAYFGAASAMGTYFAALGKTPPPGVNMAEYVLDLVNQDFTSADSVEGILDAWQAANPSPPAPGLAAMPLPTPPRRAGVATQIRQLAHRASRVALREPIQYTGRMVAIFGSMIFFSLIYLSQRQREQDQVQVRAFYIMFCLGIPTQFMIVTVFAESFIATSIRQEVKDGMYHPVAAAVASWIVQLPAMFLLSACAVLPVFVMGDLHWPAFGWALLIHACMFWTFEGIAQAQALEPSPLLGLMNYLNIYFMAFLFCGMFVPPSDVIWPFRLFTYILPMQWTMKAFMHAVFASTPAYSGALPCTAGTAIAVTLPGNLTRMANCISHANRPGYYCPNDPDGYLCFGYSGADILDSLGVKFSIFGSNTSYAECCGYVVTFGVVFRLMYLLRLLGQCSGARVPKAPEAVPTWIGTEVVPTGGAAPAVKPHSLASASSTSDMTDADAPPPSADSVYQTVFKGVSYEIPPKRGLLKKAEGKTILSQISAFVSSGEILAILGPSGSGKTTLLNALTLEPGPGATSGAFAVDGNPVDASTFIKYCAYVPREDNLWATMTARAHISLAFKCYRPELAAAERAAEVDEILAVTGMESCQETRAGDALRPGLSGGQRRRLSLAIALIKQPKLVVLDEPTSGLDSAAAAAITKLLKVSARRTNACIVCTVHQPSAAMVAGFDKVFILAEGRTAFVGPTPTLTSHLATIGFDAPSDCNPAEFVLDLVSKDMTSAESVTKVLDAWARNQGRESKVEIGAVARLAAPPHRASFCAQTLLLTRRAMTVALTDPTIYLMRMVVVAVMVSFFGLIYKESSNDSNPQAPFRLFYLWWVLCLPPALGLVVVFVTNVELKTVKTEVKNGMYSPLAYTLSGVLVQLPFMVLVALFAIVPAFAIGGWRFDHFGAFLLAFAVSMWAWESLAQLLALISNPILGMLSYVGSWTAGILFCGLVFRGEDCIWPLRAFYYLLPLKWLFNATAWNIYMPARYDDAQLCTPGTDPRCSNLGYYCANLTSLDCFGHTGAQVLETLHFSYDTLSSKDERAMDIAFILAFAVLLKTAYAYGVVRICRSSPKLQSSRRAGPKVSI